MIPMHNTDHLFTADSESGAVGDGSGGCQTQAGKRRERFFSHKVACGEKRVSSFFPGWREHRDSCTTFLKIKDRVRGISLRKEGFPWRESDDSSPHSGTRKERGDIESWLFKLNHGGPPFVGACPRSHTLREDRLQVYATEMPLGGPKRVRERRGEGRKYTLTLGSESDYTPTRRVLINSAQLVRKHFKYLGFCDSRMTPDETRRDPAVKTTGTKVPLGWTPHGSSEAKSAKKGLNRCFLQKRRAIWPAAWLHAKPKEVRPPSKPNLQVCACMRGCAGNLVHRWESTVFRCSLPEPWPWPSRNHPGLVRCRLRRMGACAVWEELNPGWTRARMARPGSF